MTTRSIAAWWWFALPALLLGPALHAAGIADGGASAPDASAEVKLSIRTTPVRGASVTWGRKKLGRTPIRLKWPRDTGPLDIQIRKTGYLTVNTRLYTFKNDTVVVKLTPVEEKHTLLGYRQPLDAGPPSGDGGLPASQPANQPIPAP